MIVGSSTGRDGIHGATFASAELTEESETVSSGAVQIGNAIGNRDVAYAVAIRDKLSPLKLAALRAVVSDECAGTAARDGFPLPRP